MYHIVVERTDTAIEQLSKAPKKAIRQLKNPRESLLNNKAFRARVRTKRVRIAKAEALVQNALPNNRLSLFFSLSSD